MIPKHGNAIKPHNKGPKSMDGLFTKDVLHTKAMKETAKGITTQEHTRGNPKADAEHVETQFGNKPRPHK